MESPDQLRTPTIQVPQWWLDSIDRARAGVSNTKIAEMVAAIIGHQVDGPAISRCIALQIKRRVAPIDLVEAISDLFDVPRPVWFSMTEDEARRFKTQRKITGLERKQDALSAQVAELRNQRQHGAIQDLDGEKPAAGVPRGVAAGGRKAPAR
jgi:hypothetical protein